MFLKTLFWWWQVEIEIVTFNNAIDLFVIVHDVLGVLANSIICNVH